MKITYYAWLKAKTGVPREEIALPDGVHDVAGLIDWLKGRNDAFAAAFANPSVIKVAVNQEVATFDQTVGPSDDIAFFPPVTGG